MTPEDRLKQLIGHLHFQMAFLESSLEQAQKKIAELEKIKENIDGA